MADRPLLQIPKAERTERVKEANSAFNPNANVVHPEPARQSQRLGPKFERLQRVVGLDPAKATLALRSEPDGIAPERAIVFEVTGSLADFYRQAERISGLEFLLEDEIEVEPDEDFYYIKKGERTPSESNLSGRLYMAMPDLQALREILRLWNMFQRGQPLPYGFAPWRTLFQLLKDVRAWGPNDRILPETLDYWRERLAAAPDRPVRFELELWFHENNLRRQRADDSTSAQVVALGGQVVSSAVIAPIRYHGLLIDLPSDRVNELLANPNITLARLDEIMYLRPQSVATFPAPEALDEVIEDDGASPTPVQLNGSPIVALFDGVPLANHQRLLGRLILDDPDDFSANAPANTRNHGTAMASLIIHGDLQAQESSLTRPLYVHPVMVYSADAQEETTPPDRLPLDVIYLAIRRLFEADGDTQPTAPSVVVVNLSLGDLNRPFTGRISAWARLVDWLSFQYRVLFLVSAGNVRRWLPVRNYATRGDFLNAEVRERENAILTAMDSEKAKRTLLSPAESLNAIAVGAWHSDAFDDPPTAAHLTDPFPSGTLPNVSSAVGLGARRSIKPDLLYEGGRELVRASEDEGHVWIYADAGGQYAGQLAAAPDPATTGRLNVERRTVGSSNATALLTRSAARIYDSLVEVGYDIPREYQAVLLKALLVHGASWGDAGERLDSLFGPAGRHHMQHRDNLARFLGYGRPEIARVFDCTAERATLFGYGDLARDKQDEFDIPLPPSIEGSTKIRRLTTTMAWLTPVNPRHQQYRSATLELLPNGDNAFSLAVERLKLQPNHYAVDRGTVFHTTFEGEKAIAFLDNGYLRVRVTCRAQAGTLDERVPYALAVSLETAVGSGIAVYDEIRAAIQPVVRATAAGT